MELPPINQRVYGLIETHAFGNVKKFAEMCDLESSQKLARCFRIDSRQNSYPTPSIDIILKIANTFTVDLNWLLLGKPHGGHKTTLENKLDILIRQNHDILEILRNK